MIGIVGAGPGGMTAALALSRVGFEVEVLERAPEVRAAGAGLTLQVNAMRVYQSLGLAERLLEAGRPIVEGVVARADGSRLGTLIDATTEPVPGIAIHRGDLARILEEALPDRVIHCGARVVHVDTEGRVAFADGTERKYEAVVGADGIHSAVRTALFGKVPLRYSGATCWRGVAERSCDVLSERWGRGLRFGSVPLGDDRTYWFATANEPEGGVDGAEPRAELCARFAHFEPLVTELIQASPTILRHDLIDLEPLDRWTKGRVTLLGDAAHAMTPNMGQGACQAIEDGPVLADALARHGVPEGLVRYETTRKPRVQSIVARSWRVGAIGQWANPLACLARDTAMSLVPRAAMRASLRALYDVAIPDLEAAAAARA